MKMDDNPRFGTSSSMKAEPFRHPSRDTFRGRKRKKTGGSKCGGKCVCHRKTLKKTANNTVIPDSSLVTV